MSSYRFLLAIITTVVSSTVSVGFDPSDKEDVIHNEEVELMRKIQIENIKLNFLKQFGVDEPPSFTKTVTQLSAEVIRKFIGSKREEPAEEEPKNQAEMFFLPVNSNYECKLYDISFCQRFEYRIPLDVELSSSEFWVYKQKPWPFNNVTVTVLCSCDGQSILNQQNDFPNENITQQWVSFNLSVLNDIECRKENIACEIETKGITMDLQNLPFLKIMKIKEVRHRREIDNHTIRNHGCKSVPFNVSFKVLGFNNWVIYPEVYQANTCEGYCLHAQNHHENLISTIIRERERNETECDHCWFTCCRPKEYKALEILYWETETTVSQRNLTDMIVVSCSCS